MAHQRKLIRQAVVAKLIAANTAAGSRVAGTRVEPHKNTQLPALSVYTLSEDTDMELSEESAPIEITRELELEIAAWVAHKDSAPADDAMDDIAEQIEAAMAGDYYIGATVAAQILTGSRMEMVEDNGRSDPLIGIVTLTYKITYRTDPVETLDSATKPDFTTGDAKYAIGGALAITAVDFTTDKLTIPAHGLVTGAGPGVFYTRGGVVPGGITPAGSYWVIVVDANTIKLAASSADALAGLWIDITDNGSGDLFLQLATPEDTFTT